MDLVSIIVPVYNVENYLKACLDSILNQSYKNLEIILSNDGSRDNSYEICKEYAKKDSRIVLINNDNMGVAHARNCGIDISTGKYIAFIDSDDVVDERYIELLINAIKVKNYDLSLCTYMDIYMEKERKQIKIEKNLLSKEQESKLIGVFKDDFCILKWYMNHIYEKLYKADIIRKYNIRFNENMIIAEDLIFNYMFYRKLSSYSFINMSLYHYFHRGNGLTSIINEKTLKCDLEHIAQKKNFLIELKIKNGAELLGDTIAQIVRKYAEMCIREKDNNFIKRYIAYVKIMKDIEKIADGWYKATDKRKIFVLKCLKIKWYFPIYLYCLLKENM